MNPKIFLVGGAVRDHLLNIESKDRDYVVVGGSEQWLLEKGFTRVGLSFPVFLHPVTGDEYALARREKKVAPGYSGFEMEFGSDVTIEEDLGRRDLTINSIAMDLDDNSLIDPYNGFTDLNKQILRHTSNAFIEDPLRVLRLARFVARYGFSVAPETVTLCKQMVVNGELNSLLPDRVWAETAKMLSEENFLDGVKFIQSIGADKIHVLSLFAGPTVNKNIVDVNLLTLDERAYFFTNIVLMSDYQAQDARIPTDLRRKLKQMFQVLGLFSQNCSAIENVVKFFDTYRNDLDWTMINHVHQVMWFEDDVLNNFKGMIDKLNALDFTELVKNIANKDIKSFVFNTKIKTIS